MHAFIWLIYSSVLGGTNTIFLIQSIVKSIIVEKAFDLNPPSDPVYELRAKSGSVCADISNVPLKLMTSLRSLSGWLNVRNTGDCFLVNEECVGKISDPILTCDGSFSVNVPTETHSLIKILTEPSESILKRFFPIQISCESWSTPTIDMSSVSTIAKSMAESAYVSLWTTVNNCSEIPQFDFNQFIDWMLFATVENQTSTCVLNAIRSAVGYLSTNDQSATSLPMFPDICYGLSDSIRRNQVKNLVPAKINISDDRIIEIPPFESPVSPQSDSIVDLPASECKALRGNEMLCQGLDVWGCFTEAGCFVDWHSGNCLDCPSGFYSDDQAYGQSACDPIPPDQIYIGLAWTNARCPSMCASSLEYMKDGNCVEISETGYFSSPCDSSLVSCYSRNDDFRSSIVFPTIGSCSNSYLSYLVRLLVVENDQDQVAFWFKFDGENADIFGLTPQGTFLFSVNGSAQITVIVNNSTISTPSVLTSGWNHVFCSFKFSVSHGGFVEVHVNGLLVTLETIPPKSTMDSSFMFIGPFLGNGVESFFNGVTIYDFNLFSDFSNPQLFFASTAPTLTDWTRPDLCMFGSSLSSDPCRGIHLSILLPETSMSTTDPPESFITTTTPSENPSTTTVDFTAPPSSSGTTELIENPSTSISPTDFQSISTSYTTDAPTTSTQTFPLPSISGFSPSSDLQLITSTSYTPTASSPSTSMSTDTSSTGAQSADSPSTDTLFTEIPSHPISSISPTDFQSMSTTTSILIENSTTTSFTSIRQTDTQSTAISTTWTFEPPQTVSGSDRLSTTVLPPTLGIDRSSANESSDSANDIQTTAIPTGSENILLTTPSYLTTTISSLLSTITADVSLQTNAEATFATSTEFPDLSETPELTMLQVTNHPTDSVSSSFGTTNCPIGMSCGNSITTRNSAADNFIPERRVPGVQTQDLATQAPPLQSYKNIILFGASAIALLLLIASIGGTIYMRYRRRTTHPVISL